MHFENSGSGTTNRNMGFQIPVSGSGFQKCFPVVTYPHLCAHHTTKCRRPSCDGKRLSRAILRVSTGSVLDTTEVPLHPDTHRVVGVGQLQPRGLHVVEGEHLAGHTSEVLQTTTGG